MSRKSLAGQQGSKSGTGRTSPARLDRRAARARLHPPPEEDLGGGDICSLEEKPSTEDNMPLVAQVIVDPPKEAEFEDYNRKRSLKTCGDRADGCRLRGAIATD